MPQSLRRMTILIFALTFSLVVALIAIVADEEIRERLGQTYWIVAMAITACVLLILAGYTWDRTLLQRLQTLHDVAERQHLMKSSPDDDVGGHDEIINLARNIEHMAQSLQKVEANYRGIVEDQVDLICRYRGDGKLIFVNSAYALFLGRKRQELIGQPFPLFHLGLAARQRTETEPADTTNFETDLQSAAGTKLWFMWTQRSIRDPQGNVLEYQAVGHDVTLRRDAEAALTRAKEEAESADRAKSTFLAMVSHEIRTPINGVRGFANLLGNTPLNDEQREHVAMIRTGAETLESLITDILDLSKMEAGKLDIETQPFSSHKCIEEVCNFLTQKARAGNLKLEKKIDPDVPSIVHGDQARVRQILSNLVDNGIRFTDRGSVTVHVSCVKTDPTGPGSHPAVRLFFSVVDTGCGIPPEKLDLLFKPFSQVVDPSPLRRRGGTGLGLIICKRLCELMGGAISVDSRVGEGSTFRFSILAEYDKRDTASPFALPKFLGTKT